MRRAPSTVEHLVPQNVPSPFNPRTQIHFSLTEDTPVTLDTYTSVGRLVRRLSASRPMTQGSHTVAWDGIDDLGRPLSSGVYLYSIRSYQGMQSGKMSLIR